MNYEGILVLLLRRTLYLAWYHLKWIDGSAPFEHQSTTCACDGDLDLVEWITSYKPSGTPTSCRSSVWWISHRRQLYIIYITQSEMGIGHSPAPQSVPYSDSYPPKLQDDDRTWKYHASPASICVGVVTGTLLSVHSNSIKFVNIITRLCYK